ncbi:MAG: TMEM165/GDT1 family protein [Candidatus Hodarchaeales archaeon]
MSNMSLMEIVNAFIFTFSMVFLMELGDKTQIMSFSLATRYKSPVKVFGGVITGLSLVTLIGVAIGLLLKNTLDMSSIKPFIGLIFIISGLFFLVSSLRRKNEENEFECPIPTLRCPNPAGRCDSPEKCSEYIHEVISKGAFRNSLILSFLAELGDKTMLMAIGLTTQVDITGVITGAIAALAAVNLIGVVAGDRIARFLPQDKLELIGTVLFIITGMMIIWL